MGIRKKKSQESWTEAAMQQKLQSFRSNPRYLLKNLFVFAWESDLLFLSKSGIWTEIEIKVSRSDFIADLKKVERHSILADKENRMKPNRFFYAVPEGIVQPDEVPGYAGLLWVNEWSSCPDMRKPAPLLHNHKISPGDLKLADKFYFNMVNAKNEAMIAKRMAEQFEDPYNQAVTEARRQVLTAALKVIALNCPYRQLIEPGVIHCTELDKTRYEICSRGLCDYLANYEEAISALIKKN